MTVGLNVRCSAIAKTTGKPCKQWAIRGGTVCRKHGGGAKQVKAKAAVRAEVRTWGLDDQHEDPGEILLRLVTQSAARCQRYSMLLEQAYDAAERLSKSTVASDLAAKLEQGSMSLKQSQALDELDQIFSVGGVAALVGKTWGAAKDVGVYATGEAIRGLAKLEADERDRCANFATKAIAAGLAERSVRLAEKQGEVFAQGITAILSKLGLTEEQQAMVPEVIEATVLELAAG